MSAEGGPTRSGTRSRSASTTSAVSSSESVVWVRYASRWPSSSSSGSTSSGVSTRTIESGRLPHRPLDLDVARVADERDLVAPRRVAARLRVHLRDERADGVDDLEAALGALLVDLRRDAVGREDDERALGNVLLGLDEDRAARLEIARRRARCGRSRGGRRPAGRGASSSFSTMSMARTTPAQKLRGLATRTRLLTRAALRGERRRGALGGAASACRVARAVRSVARGSAT